MLTAKGPLLMTAVSAPQGLSSSKGGRVGNFQSRRRTLFGGSFFGGGSSDKKQASNSSSCTHSDTQTIRYPPSDMYDIVADIERYPEFVPAIVCTKILSKHTVEEPHIMIAEAGTPIDGTEDEHPVVELEAAMEVGFKMLKERYVSVVTLEPDRRVRAVARDTSVFKYLKSEWTFEPGPWPDSCVVHFKIDFAFKSPLYASFAGMFLDEMSRKTMNAFLQRLEDKVGQKPLVYNDNIGGIAERNSMIDTTLETGGGEHAAEGREKHISFSTPTSSSSRKIK